MYNIHIHKIQCHLKIDPIALSPATIRNFKMNDVLPEERERAQLGTYPVVHLLDEEKVVKPGKQKK